MAVRFNHTIVPVRDKDASARWYAELLGLPEAGSFGPFRTLLLGDGSSLDFADDHGEPNGVHFAFLVDEDDFDAIKARIEKRGIDYWADPFLRHPGEINTNDGGRGLYWFDPDRYFLEVLTVPYGGWPSA